MELATSCLVHVVICYLSPSFPPSSSNPKTLTTCFYHFKKKIEQLGLSATYALL